MADPLPNPFQAWTRTGVRLWAGALRSAADALERWSSTLDPEERSEAPRRPSAGAPPAPPAPPEARPPTLPAEPPVPGAPPIPGAAPEAGAPPAPPEAGPPTLPAEPPVPGAPPIPGAAPGASAGEQPDDAPAKPEPSRSDAAATPSSARRPAPRAAARRKGPAVSAERTPDVAEPSPAEHAASGRGRTPAPMGSESGEEEGGDDGEGSQPGAHDGAKHQEHRAEFLRQVKGTPQPHVSVEEIGRLIGLSAPDARALASELEQEGRLRREGDRLLVVEPAASQAPPHEDIP